MKTHDHLACKFHTVDGLQKNSVNCKHTLCILHVYSLFSLEYNAARTMHRAVNKGKYKTDISRPWPVHGKSTVERQIPTAEAISRYKCTKNMGSTVNNNNNNLLKQSSLHHIVIIIILIMITIPTI